MEILGKKIQHSKSVELTAFDLCYIFLNGGCPKILRIFMVIYWSFLYCF